MPSSVIGAVGGAVVGNLLNRKSQKAADRANNAAADAAGLQSQIAAEQWDRYREMYSPLEKEVVADAQNYDTPENYARAAGEASATVADQFGKARDRLMRTPGIDPSTGAYQSSMTGLDLAQAATDATQQNAARMKVRDTAFARKVDALGLGKGLPAQASSMLASSASTQFGLGQAQQRQGNLISQGAGKFAGSIFTPENVSKAGTWLSGMGGGGGASSPSSFSLSDWSYE